MDNVLKKATDHFANIKKDNAELSEYYVKQWDATIYFYPVSTLNAKGYQVVQACAKKSQESMIESAVDFLILVAKTESGEKMFSKLDRNEMLRLVSPKVLQDIYVGIMEQDKSLLSVEEVKKS